MPRSNFTVNFPKKRTIKASGQTTKYYTFADGVHSKETYTGVSRRKPKGWIPPTNYTVKTERWRRAEGRRYAYRISNPNQWSETIGCLGGNSPHNTLNHFNELVSYTGAGVAPMSSAAAVVAARNKFKRFNVDLGIAFAERKMTARHVGDTAVRLSNAIWSLRHGKFRQAARWLGILSDPGRPRGSNWTNHWLGLQYAWKPLLADIYGGCNALATRDIRDWRVTAKAFRSEETNYYKFATSWEGSAVRHQGVFVRIDALPGNDLIMSLSSLGVLNPLLVAWEVVPYSFVLDWFLPIGSWLDSLDALLGYTDIHQSVTTYTETVYSGVGKDFVSNGWQYENDWHEWGEFKNIIRTAGVGSAFSTFPRIKDAGSLGHMANGLSLLAGALGRSPVRNWR